MPGLGEEGNEYASFEDLSKTLTNESQSYGLGSPQQTKNIAGDLPLHAPKACEEQNPDGDAYRLVAG
jgi:hypothetical protein